MHPHNEPQLCALLAAALLLASLCSACAPALQPPTSAQPCVITATPAPIDISGRMKLRVYDAETHHSLRASFRLSDAPFLRIDVLSPLYQPVLILTIDATRIRVLDIGTSRLFAGPASSADIDRLLGIPLDALGLVSLLRGEIPAALSARLRPCSPHAPGCYTAAAPAASLRLDPGDCHLAEIRFVSGVYITLTDYEPLADTRLPGSISIHGPDGTLRAVIRISGVRRADTPALPTLDPSVRGLEILPLSLFRGSLLPTQPGR